MIALVFASLFPLQEPQLTPRTWGLAEVDAYVRDNTPKTGEDDDPFATPAASPRPASIVVLSVPVSRSGRSDAADHIDAFWSYNSETQQLTLEARPEVGSTLMTLTPSPPDGGDFLRRPKAHQVWLTHEVTERSDGGSRSNAFGATVQVTNVRSEQRGIAQLAPGMDNPGPAYPDRYASGYKFTKAISPEFARELVNHLRFEVVATPREYSPGKWVICGIGGFSPTIRSPISSLDSGCYLTVVVESVRFVDSSDGTIVASSEISRRR